MNFININFLHFLSVMKRSNASNPSLKYHCTTAHLNEFYRGNGTPMGELYNKHYIFISTGLSYIRGELTEVSNTPSDLSALLATYDVLLNCLNRLILEFTSTTFLYDHWVWYIKFLISRGEYMRARTAIPEFMVSLGIVNNTRSVVPAYETYTHHNKCEPLILLDILEGYIQCLSHSNLGIDFGGLVDVIEDLHEWFNVFDGDMARRKRLVEYLMQRLEFDDGELSAKLFGITLVEHAKVCKDDHMAQLGVTFVIKKKIPFLLEVLRHLAPKFPVELEDCQGTNEWTRCMNQLKSYEERGYLSRTICINIESIISYRLLEDMLHDKSPHLLKAMNLIANARTLREKKANDCLENLNNAIWLCQFHANANDQGPSCFLQAQALCLRALCLYEDKGSYLKTFIQDMNKALMLWSNNNFVDDNEYILQYTTKLLLVVFDVLITDHNEDSHELLEDILNFMKKSGSKMGMLWQFKSHHIHVESEMIHNQFEQCFVENYGDWMEEGESNNKLERMISYNQEEVGWLSKSACLRAHLCYNLGEKMLVMGSMTKGVKYAREGRRVRYRLIRESFLLPSKNQSGERAYALLMNPVVAARVWSLNSEDFLLAPNNNFISCLMSMHQEATILELMGNGFEALKLLKHGQTLSLRRGFSFFAGHFQAAIGKIHRKSQDFKLAEVQLKQAKEQCRHISCRKCNLLLTVEISKESVKHIRKKGSHSHNTQATKDDLVSAANMLRKEVINSKGCKDWERSCWFSLLSLLIEIGKDHIFNDRTMEAQDVFLENIKLVVGLSSLPSTMESQRKFSSFVNFFDFIETSEIKFSCGIHVAHIIYMISWLAYKMSKDTRKIRVDHFSIPIAKLISSLKLALVLSSEVPELFQKVAQLLAIMYFVSHEEIHSPKVTCFQWACFFQQLTVGSDVNYSFSDNLHEVYGVSDPDNTLHRLTPSENADLTEFVTKFFEDLQPHTILVINIIGHKYKDLLKMVLQTSLPSDCVALMMISRFNSKREPLVGLFPLGSVPVVESGKQWEGPWGTDTIVDTIAPEFKEIIKDYHISKSRPVLYTLDGRIGTFMSRMESWFGHHKYILLGEPVGSPMNSNLHYFSGFVGIGVNDESMVSTTYGVSSSHGSKSEDTSKREPVILVLDKNIQMLPWERMEALKDHEYYRMPSVSSIFYTYYVCDKSGRKTERNSAIYAIANPFDAYYVISPANSLDQEQCRQEHRLAKYFKEELQLDGKLWEHVEDFIVEILRTHSFFMYAGHGDGLDHIPGGAAALRRLDRCASSSLMGCGSGLLKLTGPYTPIGAPIDYLLAGSPIVISNLYNIYSSWAGYLYHRLLKECKDNMSMADESGFGSCLVTARNSTDKLLMGCGTICYGVPTLIRQGAK